MISTVIFDLDGLLSDTEPLHRRAYQKVLARRGVRLSAAYAAHWIRAGKGIVEFLGKKRLTLDVDSIRAEKAEAYAELVARSARPMPGAVALLDLLRGRKTLALASSSYPAAVAAVLEALRIKEYFRLVVTQGDVDRVKPWPDLFLCAAARLNVEPSECVVLEDAEKGVMAAHAAGMKCIAVPNEYTRDNDFSKATLVVKSLRDVTLEMIESL
jgi:HAD superfamily hydrolase (TIGR01509 family)